MKDKYINFFTDFGFKRLFGSEPSKELLIDFLNSLLEGYEAPIVNLTYKNTEKLGSTELDRKAVFDLYCETKTGEKIIVEMQKASQKYFKDRSVFYSTFPIQEQAEKGDWNYELKAVYTIGILNFVFDEDKDDLDKYLYRVKLSDIETNRVFYDKLSFIYLEMPKFTKGLDELQTHFEKWMYALRNISQLENVPEQLQERIFEKFFSLARIAKLNGQERESYQKSLKYYRDMHNVIDTAEEKGWIKGLEKGREEMTTEMVGRMVKSGMAVKAIADITSLSLDEVKAITDRLGL